MLAPTIRAPPSAPRHTSRRARRRPRSELSDCPRGRPAPTARHVRRCRAGPARGGRPRGGHRPQGGRCARGRRRARGARALWAAPRRPRLSKRTLSPRPSAPTSASRRYATQICVSVPVFQNARALFFLRVTRVTRRVARPVARLFFFARANRRSRPARRASISVALSRTPHTSRLTN